MANKDPDIGANEINKSAESPSQPSIAAHSANDAKVSKSPFNGLWSLTNRELAKWYKVPMLLFLSLVQPVIWLSLFGKAFNIASLVTPTSINIPGLNIPKALLDQIAAALSQGLSQGIFAGTDYFSFLSVGMLGFIILSTAMFSGFSIVWDRRFGFLNKALSTPVARGTIVMGKVLSSVVRSLIQAAIVLIIAVLLGMNTSYFTVIGVIGTFIALFLLTFGFSSFFLMLALRSGDWQTQMAIANLLLLPLLFGSNALFPISAMPGWLQAFVRINPISYSTDIGRQLLLHPASTSILNTVPFDLAYLGGFAIILSLIGIVASWKLLTK